MTTTLLDATRTCGISGDRWHREQTAGPAHKLLLRVVLRLRFRVRTIKERSYDLLEDFLADVHSAVDAIGRLNPIHFANSDFPQLSFSAIAELDVGVRDLAIEEAAEYLARIGVPREKLCVTGIPIDPLFAAPLNRFEARKRLGLDADAAVILISAGGYGVGPVEQLVRDLLTLQRPWQIVAIAGKSEKTRKRLEELAREAGKLPRGSPKALPRWLHNRDGQVHGGGRPDGGKSGRADDFGGALALFAHGAHRTDPRPGRTQRRSFAGGGSGDSLQQFARGRLEDCGPAG